MKKKLLSVAALACLLSLSAPAMAATSFEPGIKWQTIESENFRVNYPDGLEELGRRVLAYAEDAHKKVAPFMGVKPYEKTEIICFDTYDDTNANASNYPHNRIMLNLHPPSPDSGFAIGRYDDWIRYVILHEYTHILHQNETPWAIYELNSILGKVFFSRFAIPGVPSYVTEYIPNLLSDSPRFVTEGWAVTTESKFTPGGRAKEGDLDMKLRMAALEKCLLSIDQVNGSYLLDWPSGGNEYDYGTAFFDYLINTYGEDKPSKILNVLGKTPWLGIDFAVSQVLPGKTCNSLWDEMMGWIHVRYAKQAAEIQKEPLTSSTALTTTGRHHHHPRWLPDGGISVTESYKGKSAGVVKVAPNGITRLFGKDSLSDYSVSADGRYFYYSTEGEDENRFKSYSDLFRFDSQTREVKQLTDGLRAVEPALSPDGQSLVAIATAKGSNHLLLLDAEGKVLKRLTEPTLEETWANPSWAPDGKRFVVSRWSKGRYNLVTVDPATGKIEPLTTGDALDFYPAYTPDGKYVTFTSDRSGVFNLYALRLSDRKLYRLTNVLGGAFDARVSPDGKRIAFLNYTSKGYDLHSMPFEPATFKPVGMGEAYSSNFKGEFVPRQAVEATPVEMDFALSAAPRPYSPWPSMIPNTYSPLIAQDESGMLLGMSAYGQDILRQHTYYAIGGMGVFSQRPIYGLYYQNDQWMPSLTAQYFRTPATNFYPIPLSTGQSTLGLMWQDQQSVEVSARFPGIPLPLLGAEWVNGDSYQVGFKALHAQNYALSTLDLSQKVDLPTDPATGKPVKFPSFELATDEGQTNSVYAVYQRANSFRRSYGISPEGSLASIGYEKSSPMLGGNGNFDRVWADYRQYIPMPWASQHVLALRGATGLNWSKNGGHFVVGGNDSRHFLSQIDLTAATSFTESRLAFKGYGVAGIGNKLAVLSSEYRFPLFEIGKGLWTLPLYVDRVYGVVGADVGNVWDSPFSTVKPFQANNTLAGVSAEARAQINLFRYLRTELRLGVEQGLLTPAETPGGTGIPGTQVIMGFGTTF